MYGRVDNTALVAGYFDPLHAGHIALFKFAKQFGRVIVATHPVEHVLLKSPFYIYDLETKLALLRGYSDCVDETYVAHSIDVAEVILALKPTYFVKGSDYLTKPLPQLEVEACQEVGCKILYHDIPMLGSSSAIKANILEQLKWKSR